MIKLSWLIAHRALACAFHVPSFSTTGATHSVEAAVRKSFSNLGYEVEPFHSSGSGAMIATVEALSEISMAINMTINMTLETGTWMRI